MQKELQGRCSGGTHLGPQYHPALLLRPAARQLTAEERHVHPQWVCVRTEEEEEEEEEAQVNIPTWDVFLLQPPSRSRRPSSGEAARPRLRPGARGGGAETTRRRSASRRKTVREYHKRWWNCSQNALQGGGSRRKSVFWSYLEPLVGG